MKQSAPALQCLTAEPDPRWDARRMRTLTNDESYELMRRVSDRFPVDRWRIGGTAIWPLVCYDLHHANQQYTAHTVAVGSSRWRSRRLSRVSQVGSGLGGFVRAALLDHSLPVKRLPATAALYSDGVSLVKLGGKWLERFCDPFADLLEANGVSSVTLTPLNEYRVPRYRPTLYMQPAIDAASLWANARHAVASPERMLSLPGFDDARRFVELEGAATWFWTADRFSRLTYFVDVYAALYSKLFRLLGVRSCFIVCYYGAERMAMCLAARRLGIPSVDIQHGAAGESRFWAYSAFEKMPRDGYALVPEYFWCWSPGDASEIERWGGLRHKAIVAGNQLLSTWRDDKLQLAATSDREVSEERSRNLGRSHVLVTLNGYESEERLGAMLRFAIRNQDLQFWFRAHPSRLAQIETLKRLQHELSAANVEIEKPTNWPLYSLLRNVDFHATEVSSTTFEAEAFGVPTVLTHRGEGVAYQRVVERGFAVFVEGFQDLRRGLDELAGSRTVRAAGNAGRRSREEAGLVRMTGIARGNRV